MKHVAVIGGGIAGMEAASVLASYQHHVTLIEKTSGTGGKLNDWSHLFPDFTDPDLLLGQMRNEIRERDVNIIHNTEIRSIRRQNGGFELSDGRYVKLRADAVVVAAGFNPFDASLKEEYGYGMYDNVFTSLDMERMFREGPSLVTRQGRNPERLAIIHCVGSRDAKTGNQYCSKVCCITGIKQAIEINRRVPECEIFCFYMDLRLYGATFDSLYLKAQRQHKIQFIRGRLSEAAETRDHGLMIKAEDTLSGRPLRMQVDMMVLLVGMEPCEASAHLCSDSGLEADENGFFRTRDEHWSRSHSTTEGVFLAGACTCPMSVSETLEHARSAALATHRFLHETACHE